MRILIIAQSRTGSTVFSKWLSKELNYYWLNEPFNSNIKSEIDKIFTEKNIVCKICVKEIESNFIGRQNIKIKNINDLLLLTWDKIFVLTRNDSYDQAISKVWASLNNKWHSNYEITDKWAHANKKHIEKCYEELVFEKKQINLINSTQITYEGIYETGYDLQKVCSMIGINKMNYFNDLSLKNRYRGGHIVQNNKLI